MTNAKIRTAIVSVVTVVEVTEVNQMTDTQQEEKMYIQVDNKCIECGEECHCVDETCCPHCNCVKKAMDRDGPA